MWAARLQPLPVDRTAAALAVQRIAVVLLQSTLGAADLHAWPLYDGAGELKEECNAEDQDNHGEPAATVSGENNVAVAGRGQAHDGKIDGIDVALKSSAARQIKWRCSSERNRLRRLTAKLPTPVS